MKLMHQDLSSKSKRGAFGEFVYANFCKINGFDVLRTNFCHTDYFLSTKTKTNSWYVDVKTTERSITRYGGRRFHDEILYELIFFKDQNIYLAPDSASPFNKGEPILLGQIDYLQSLWLDSKPLEHLVNDRTNYLRLGQLIESLKKSSFKKIRLIERGDASSSRWSGTVDNLPGSDKVINENDATIFIQYKCIDFQEKIDLIFFISHALVVDGFFIMTEPKKRQKDKGINRVLDIEEFIKNHQQFVFKSLDELERYINSNLIFHT